MKKIFFIICLLIICFCSCEHKTKEDYIKEVDEKIDKAIAISRIERDNHTYIVFHNMYESFGIVHDPDCSCYLKQDTISNDQLIKSIIYNIINTPNYTRHSPKHLHH